MIRDGAVSTEMEPQQHLSRIMDGYLSTQLLYVATELRIPDALADAPLSSREVAQTLQANPDALHRILRGLAVEQVIEEHTDGRFSLTPAGELLRDGVPGSVRGSVLARGGLYYRAATGLLDAARRGGAAFEPAYGMGFFDYLTANPNEAAAFEGSMSARSAQEASDVLAAYDFGRFRRLVDVGGGQAILLTAILGSAPDLRAVLIDRPSVVEAASARLKAAGFLQRCQLVAGDFFADVPAGGDLYLLSRIIHNWDDDAATRILCRCRDAMPDDSTLLLVECVLPECARDQPSAIRMDLHMLTLLGGRERTAAQYRSLLAAAGFTLAQVIATGSPAGICVLEARPST